MLKCRLSAIFFDKLAVDKYWQNWCIPSLLQIPHRTYITGRLSIAANGQAGQCNVLLVSFSKKWNNSQRLMCNISMLIKDQLPCSRFIVKSNLAFNYLLIGNYPSLADQILLFFHTKRTVNKFPKTVKVGHSMCCW